MKMYDPSDWYWCVGNSINEVFSSKRVAFVSVTDTTFQTWRESGGVVRQIRNEVELQDVLLRSSPTSAMTRVFTASEILAAFQIIDLELTNQTFSEIERINPTSSLAHRLMELADVLQINLGAIEG